VHLNTTVGKTCSPRDLGIVWPCYVRGARFKLTRYVLWWFRAAALRAALTSFSHSRSSS